MDRVEELWMPGKVVPMVEWKTVVVQDSALRQAGRMNEVLSAGDGYLLAFCPFPLSGFLNYCARFEPCVAIADLEPADCADGALEKTLRAHPSMRLLVRREVLVASEAEAFVKLGCWGVIEKDSEPESLKKAVEAIAEGDIWVGRKLLSKMLREMTFAEEHKLSPREVGILKLLAQDLTNNSIAEALFISPETLRWHLRNLYSKTGIHDRQSIIAYARKVAGNDGMAGVKAAMCA
jgi:DNA-binding NarL/FixJ family response regulator